jgi:hypothetical protein
MDEFNTSDKCTGFYRRSLETFRSHLVHIVFSKCYMYYLILFYESVFRMMYENPKMTVFWSSLMSCSPGMMAKYFLSYLETVPVAPIIIGITFAFTFHIRRISMRSSFYFKIFSVSFLITFLSVGIAVSIKRQVPFLFRVIISCLLFKMVLSVLTCWLLLLLLTVWIATRN